MKAIALILLLVSNLSLASAKAPGTCDGIIDACNATIQAEDQDVANLKKEVQVLKADLKEHESATPWYDYLLIGAAIGFAGGYVLKH